MSHILQISFTVTYDRNTAVLLCRCNAFILLVIIVEHTAKRVACKNIVTVTPTVILSGHETIFISGITYDMLLYR